MPHSDSTLEKESKRNICSHHPICCKQKHPGPQNIRQPCSSTFVKVSWPSKRYVKFHGLPKFVFCDTHRMSASDPTQTGPMPPPRHTPVLQWWAAAARLVVVPVASRMCSGLRCSRLCSPGQPSLRQHPGAASPTTAAGELGCTCSRFPLHP